MTTGSETRLFLDREEERSLLARVARGEEAIRLVSICTGRFGKTSLLAWLEDHCRTECGVPAARVEIDKQADKTCSISSAGSWRSLRFYHFKFRRFDYLDLARTDEDFRRSERQRPRSGSPHRA